MNTELAIIADIAKKFNALGIPYMLTGSIAMNYYVEPRMTWDINVVDCSGIFQSQLSGHLAGTLLPFFSSANPLFCILTAAPFSSLFS